MDTLTEVLYTAEATTDAGGREGHVRSSDGIVEFDLARPKEFKGKGGEGTNPEQLFAAGYSACFMSALGRMARRARESIDGTTVTARVGIGPVEENRFGLEVELHVRMPEVDRETAEDLVEQAHQVCPYSNATRGNIGVRLTVED